MLVAILFRIEPQHLAWTILRVKTMKESKNDTVGIQRIVKRYKTRFRVPENLNFYSREDLMAAERKFLKHVLLNGGFEPAQPGSSPVNQISRDRSPDIHHGPNR